MVISLFNPYTIAKAIGGLGQLAGAAQYAHRQYNGSDTHRRPSYPRRSYRMRPSPFQRYRNRYRKPYVRHQRYHRRIPKHLPVLRPGLKRRLQRAKFGSIGGVKKFKTIVLNKTLDNKYLDEISAKSTENKIHAVNVLKAQWIPNRNDIAYDKVTTFEAYEQCRLKVVVIELRNFNERRLIKYSDDRVEERTPTRMLMRYFWDSTQLLGGQDASVRTNFNKLNKKKYVYKQGIKPSFTYKYTPKYHLNEGWAEFQNSTGYGTYTALFDVYNSAFKAFAHDMMSKPVTRFRVTGGDTSATVDQPQFLPTFYFAHELEYDTDQFDTTSDPHIQDVHVHMNFEINIKTVWEFKNPRIDPLV